MVLKERNLFTCRIPKEAVRMTNGREPKAEEAINSLKDFFCLKPGIEITYWSTFQTLM